MKITRSQARYVQGIRDFFAERGYSPTQTELGEYLGVHRNAVYNAVKALRANGVLPDKRGSHSISLPNLDALPNAPGASPD